MSRINIGLIMSNFTGYCDYCYNHAKDYDETEVDCGGLHCPPCVEYKERFDWLKLVIIISWSLLVLLVIGYVFFVMRTPYTPKEKLKKKIEKIEEKKRRYEW